MDKFDIGMVLIIFLFILSGLLNISYLIQDSKQVIEKRYIVRVDSPIINVWQESEEQESDDPDREFDVKYDLVK